METLLQDIRYAVRRLARSPGFTAGAVLLLALGVGANVALFTALDALLLRARAGVRDASSLVWISPQSRGRGRLSEPVLARIGGESGAFESVAGFRDDEFTVAPRADARPLRVRGQAVTGTYFTMLRARAVLGRTIAPRDDDYDAPLVVVLAHDFWLRTFGGADSVIGHTIAVNGRQATIVGVAEAGFNGADVDESRTMWLPLRAAYGRLASGQPAPAWLAAIGRLRGGETPQHADAALAALTRRLSDADTSLKQVELRTYPAATGVPPGGMMKLLPIAALCLAVTFSVLLIACANLGNLLLARGITRHREIAVRMAMGAGRRRIVRQLLVESGVLGISGAFVGTLFAFWAIDAFNAAHMLPLSVDAVVDLRVALATFAFALAAALMFGIAPAFDATRRDVNASLRDVGPGLDPRRARSQGRLVVAQVAVSVMLLAFAGLFLESLRKQEIFELGFDTSDHVLAVVFNADELTLADGRRDAFVRGLRERAAAMPGVEAVAYADQLPLGEMTVSIVVHTDSASAGAMGSFRTSVDPDYFRIIGVSLKEGRAFTTNDGVGSEPVVVVSEAFARRAWPGRSAVGHSIRFGDRQSESARVIGVATDVHMHGAETGIARPLLYFPRAQESLGLGTHLLVRTAGDARLLVPAIEREARSLDPAIPLYKVQTMAQYRRDNLDGPRNASRLMTLFGALALALASLGLYAVLSFTVQQRRREIGVRIALGAPANDVVGLFVRRGARFVAYGLAIGLGAALLLSQLLRSMLFGIGVPQLGRAALPVLGLAAATLVAAWLPARRAARVDPMDALRAD